MTLVGAAHNPLVSGIDELPGNTNYFIGKNPSQWRTNVPTYAKVHYREVYLTSEPVFFASGLAPDVSHTMVITVTGTTTSDGAYIAVDAFDVMR